MLQCGLSRRNFSLAMVSDILFLNLERVKGIEPSYSAWKAAALPLSYTRLITSW
jgi:hypothetical protein